MCSLGKRAEVQVLRLGDVLRGKCFVQVRFGLAQRAECDVQVTAKLAGGSAEAFGEIHHADLAEFLI